MAERRLIALGPVGQIALELNLRWLDLNDDQTQAMRQALRTFERRCTEIVTGAGAPAPDDSMELAVISDLDSLGPAAPVELNDLSEARRNRERRSHRRAPEVGPSIFEDVARSQRAATARYAQPGPRRHRRPATPA